MGKCRKLALGFKMPPRYKAASADSTARVMTIGTAQNRTVRVALGSGAAWRVCGCDIGLLLSGLPYVAAAASTAAAMG